MKIIFTFIIFLYTIPAFLSCSLLNISKTDLVRSNQGTVIDTKKYPENNTSVISGVVNLTDSILTKQKPIVLVAYSVNSKSKSEKHNYNYVILDRTPEFMLYVPAGDYFLFVIIDKNNDFLYRSDETIAVFGKPDKVSVQTNQVISGIEIQTGDMMYSGNVRPDGFSVQYDFNSVEYNAYNGQNRKIYSEIFSYDNAKIGWWHPSLFMKAFGTNIYMPKDYDPEKIPILFVHGAQGTPYDFAYFHFRLKNSKFQPMYFYYPSGMRLPMLSELLYLKIEELKNKYKFKQLYIVAHSMGGLVSRAMITNHYKDNENFIKLFISMATPWAGFESADNALKTSPYVLPSWIDVSAQSMFIKTSLKKNLPDTIDYYMFFGKLDTTSKGRGFDSRVYSEAKGIFGSNTDHSTILSSREVFDKFIEVLDAKHK